MGTLAALKKRYRGKLINAAFTQFINAIDAQNYARAARIAVLTAIAHTTPTEILNVLRYASLTYEQVQRSFYKASPLYH